MTPLFLTIAIVIRSWPLWSPLYMHLRTNTGRYGVFRFYRQYKVKNSFIQNGLN